MLVINNNTKHKLSALERLCNLQLGKGKWRIKLGIDLQIIYQAILVRKLALENITNTLSLSRTLNTYYSLETQVLFSQFMVGSGIGNSFQTLCRNFSGIITVEMQENPPRLQGYRDLPLWMDWCEQWVPDRYLNLLTLVSLCLSCLLTFSYGML